MPRPKTKDDLLIAAKKEAHWSRDKNVRDVLIHLYEWHQLMLKFPKKVIQTMNSSCQNILHGQVMQRLVTIA